ncbi:hypothetical protein [Vibrio sp. LaRot3]|uniref:hypothetical protein n=1 Tax=Vibrio sp. LaRot3 TaxID=2998829 RepID=UPI0022CDBFB3|nr:hypothetical protein [Vibrio sp. LaRot3]MDA0148379.1 hypothetical protein [Vibrio sp. LaRot3]
MKLPISDQTGQHRMRNPKHFELLRAQINKLSPQQLMVLRGEINTQLDDYNSVSITDEEALFINKLFN